VFFAVSQIVALVMFRESVSWQTMVGGTLIVAGGFVLLIE
jgi:drug/metabolite transporter (DMT)-like permease